MDTIEVMALAYNIYPVRMIISVTPSTTIEEIRYEILQHIRWIEKSRIQLTFKSKILQDSGTVESLKLAHHDIIDVTLIQDKIEPIEEFASADLFPKFTKPGYTTKPSWIEMAFMTEEELKTVKNFTIVNKFGKIVFDGETNVTGLDLDKAVEIRSGEVKIYHSEEKKPKIGEGLNKPATIYLFNCDKKWSIPDDLYIENPIKIQGEGAEFVRWNSISKIWVFKVQHF